MKAGMILILAIFALTLIALELRERWIWNNGVCRQSGEDWFILDDENGEVIYTDRRGNVFVSSREREVKK